VQYIKHFSYFDTDYPTSGLIVTGLPRVYFMALTAKQQYIYIYIGMSVQIAAGTTTASTDVCDVILSRYWQIPSTVRSRDSAVGIATGYGLYDRGVEVRVSVGSRIFSSPRHPERPGSPLSLLSNGYRGYSGRGVELITRLQLVPRLRKYGSIHPFPHTPS
jgi:hypothetical protein